MLSHSLTVSPTLENYLPRLAAGVHCDNRLWSGATKVVWVDSCRLTEFGSHNLTCYRLPSQSHLSEHCTVWQIPCPQTSSKAYDLLSLPQSIDPTVENETVPACTHVQWHLQI